MKYWAYVNNEILGPFEKEKLLELPSFSPSLLVCPQTPVGEKTEDWKEAATYPELSALIGSGGMQAGKAAPTLQTAPDPFPALHPSPAPEAGPAAAEPAPSLSLKPLTASSIDPVAPQEHKFGGPEIAVSHLGKAGGEAAASPAPAISQPQPSVSAFDPISLSQIERRSENVHGQEAAEQPAIAPAPEPSFAPSNAPVLETFARPMQAASGADKAATDALAQKLDALARNVVSKQDLSVVIDPFRMKLDQIGEVVSSMKNSQFQREIMDKLAHLENAIGEIKISVKQGGASAPAASPQPSQIVIEKNSDTVFGVQPRAEKPAEKPKEAPVKAQEKPVDIVDTGSKRSRIGPLLGKLVRSVVTIVLLAVVLLGAVIGLKKFGVFDATKFIPFPLPFAGEQAQAPQAQAAQPLPAAQPAAAQPSPAQPPAAQAQTAQPGQQGGQAAQAQAQQPKAPDISPEIIYFTRTYKGNPRGRTLEDALSDHSAAEGGDYAKVNWQVKPGAENIYEITALIPSKSGGLSYSFIVDYGKKTLLPADETAKLVLRSITISPSARRTKAAGRKKGTARTKPKAGKSAAAKKGNAQDEYEYVYEDDDGTGK